MKQTKVILDIMALGAGYKNYTGRTGIYRVVENLVKGFNESPRCDLSLISTQFEKESNFYLEERVSLKQRELIYPKSSDYIINKIKNYVSKSHLNKKVCDFLLEYIVPHNNLEELAHKADIYHSPYMPIPKEIKSVTKIRKFLTVHDLIPIFYPQYFENNNNSLVEHAIKSLGEDGFAICVSQSTKDDLCNFISIDPNRVFVSHLAASKDKFYQVSDLDSLNKIRVKYGIGQDLYFLTLCTLEPRKNISHVIRSFASLIKSNELKNVNLVLAGTKGWDFKDLFDQLNDSEISHKIIFTGFVDDQDLASLYSGCLAFIYTSIYEGFGLPVLEAMQCGKPVISSNVSSIPEVVQDAGILLSPTDQDALCQAMLDLYDHEDLRNNLSKKAILQSQKFTWENCISQNLDAYEKALNT